MDGFKLPWFAYVMIAISVGYYLFKTVFPFFKNVKRVMNKQDFAKNPDGSTLSNQQQQFINVGAINGEQLGSYIDSIETGIDKARMTKGLSEWWGIDTQADAYETLDRIKDSGHRYFYDAIFPIFKNENVKNWKTVLKERTEDKDTLNQCMDYLDNLKETYPTLLKEGYQQEDFDKGILAWDMGRVVAVSRMCYDMKFIDEPTSWNYIQQCYQLTKDQFSSWEEFAKSYVIGRCMWNGDSLSLDGIKDIAEGLIKNDNSPWKTNPL